MEGAEGPPEVLYRPACLSMGLLSDEGQIGGEVPFSPLLSA